MDGINSPGFWLDWAGASEQWPASAAILDSMMFMFEPLMHLIDGDRLMVEIVPNESDLPESELFFKVTERNMWNCWKLWKFNQNCEILMNHFVVLEIFLVMQKHSPTSSLLFISDKSV